MIFIAAKFQVKDDFADSWPVVAADFTAATRAEPGCLWFEWSRSVDDPGEYVLLEAFRDEEAASHHVNSEHFRQAQRTLPSHLVRTPRIVNAWVGHDDWSVLGELSVD
ncbi:putative quinol monooxygenase [Natronoglycomyces albus]|uniref:Antibiotic biosynthesis monooxygenase n=1 Tax=Natronoglycomyces albus TaxID=2811108 RepID=A0A895XX63_9ACTN|nr:putative quinol monooxygenase [Natronoglycomyces albus]QSB06810.1 antibiotic biosynthesis monooxygenase [Natronoglycomyces albus]